jgi:hypothetical protein
MKNNEINILTDLLEDLLNKGNAHVSLDAALNGIPFSLLGEKPNQLPYSIWQLAEHLRISQRDILEFSRDAKYVSPKWPEEYWPAESKPAEESLWNDCVIQIKSDRKAFINLIKKAGDKIYIQFDYGDGQSLLKEALVLADHNSYHAGEIIIVRRLLGNWK